MDDEGEGEMAGWQGGPRDLAGHFRGAGQVVSDNNELGGISLLPHRCAQAVSSWSKRGSSER